MLPPKFALVVILFIVPLLCIGQKEANVWVLQTNAGIDFNYHRFTPFGGTGITSQLGATASICDKKTGQLLFYTDGRSVWNCNFRKMPNGTGLRGGYTATQAALIVPHPGGDQRYFLFTTKSYHDTIPLIETDSKFTGLYYSVIDMQLDGWLGDVVQDQKNIPLQVKSTDKLTAVPHTNGKDYWLITHEWGSNRFLVFPVAEEGIGLPRYFPIGITYTGSIYGYSEAEGWLLPSPNGKMLACAVHSGEFRPLELYDFDASTGTISNVRELGNYQRLFGVSFSPDNSKLYFTSTPDYNPTQSRSRGFYQMDLNAGDTEDIINSATELYFVHETGVGGYDTLSGGSLQLAPDGRLYSELTFGDSENKESIFFIDKPNLPGWLCDPSSREFQVRSSKVIGIGSPNFMQSYFNNLEPTDNYLDENECGNIGIRIFPNPTEDKVQMGLGDVYENCVFPLRINIYNPIGQKISTLKIFDKPLPQIDLSGYASGIYLLAINSPYTFSTYKVIKK